MLVCIPKDRIVSFHEIQKHINIEHIFSDVKYFESEEKAFESGFIPITVCVSIRSAYTNLVVAHDVVKDIERYYITITNIPNHVPFYGEDLLAYLSSLAVTQAYDPSDPEVQRVMASAKFIPVGVLQLDDKITYPYFYSQIIINDDFEQIMKNHLKEGYRIIPIKDMNKRGNLKQIVNEIFEIKEK